MGTIGIKPKEQMFGNRIREILQEKGMCSKELSDLTGIYTPHLSKIINGQRKCISLPIAIKIAIALKTPVEQVFIYEKPIVAQLEDDGN